MGRRGYPPEFRRKVLDLVEAGRPAPGRTAHRQTRPAAARSGAAGSARAPSRASRSKRSRSSSSGPSSRTYPGLRCCRTAGCCPGPAGLRAAGLRAAGLGWRRAGPCAAGRRRLARRWWRCRRRLTPQAINKPVNGDDLVGVQGQHGQQGSLLGAPRQAVGPPPRPPAGPGSDSGPRIRTSMHALAPPGT